MQTFIIVIDNWPEQFDALRKLFEEDKLLRIRFLLEPKVVLKELGWIFPDHIHVGAYENRAEELHIPLPLGDSMDKVSFSTLDRDYERLIQRSWRDKDFRLRLLENPKSAVEEELKIELPEALHLEFHPAHSRRFIIVLPPLLAFGAKPVRTEIIIGLAGY